MALDFNSCAVLASGNVRTPKARMSYVYFEDPNPKAKVTSGNNAGKFKYTCTILIPKTADITLLKKAAETAAIEEFGLEKFKMYVEAEKFHTPFLDAFKISKTEKNPAGDDRMKDFIAIRTDSLTRPGIVESNGQPIGDDFSGVYAGRWAFFSLNASAYPSIDGGKPGAKFYLSNVQLLDHDERLGGGRPDAQSEFAPVEGMNGGGDGTADSVFGGGSSVL